jgi:hypothetical protein
MSKFKVLALAATLVMATAGLAIAGDCDSKAAAETASASGCSSSATAETAAAKTASAEGCSKSAAAQTASAEGCDKSAAVKTASAGSCDKSAAAQTASAGGCDKGAAAQTAGAQTASAEGCASSAAVKTAGANCASGAAAQTAGAGCASEAGVSAKTVQIDTVRMPSGAMAVFYSGTNAETVAFLQSKANEGCSGFVCDMAKSMAADENVTTEIAATEHGVMILVTATSDAASVDKYEEQYAAVVESMDEEQGE